MLPIDDLIGSLEGYSLPLALRSLLRSPKTRRLTATIRKSCATHPHIGTQVSSATEENVACIATEFTERGFGACSKTCCMQSMIAIDSELSARKPRKESYWVAVTIARSTDRIFAQA